MQQPRSPHRKDTSDASSSMRRSAKWPPVMSDVADLAGVSVPTVSRVLNSPDLVTPETQDRVLEAIKSLGYRPNMAARALKTRQSRLLGVIHPSGTLFGPASMTAAIEAGARARGYAPIVGISDSRDEDAALLEHFRTMGVAGIVLVGPSASLVQQARRHATMVPVVTISGDDHLANDPVLGGVLIDNHSGARDVVRHILAHGHTNICLFGGPNTWPEAQTRSSVWIEELSRAKIDASNHYTIGWLSQPAYAMARRVLSQPDRPTAIIAANDDIAIGIIRAAYDCGLRVPKDLAVVGFDDIQFAPYVTPALTTVEQPFLEAGAQAIEVLVEILHGSPPIARTLPTRLVVRQSCGCPPPLE